MNSIFYNSKRDLGQKKLEIFCGRRWMKAGSCFAEEEEGVGLNWHYQFKSDWYILHILCWDCDQNPTTVTKTGFLSANTDWLVLT